MSDFVRSKPHTYELLIGGRAHHEIRTFLVIHVRGRTVAFSVERHFPSEYITEREGWFRREPEIDIGPTFDSYDLRMQTSYSRALLGLQIEWLGRDELRGKSEQEALYNLMWGLLIKPGSTWAKEAAPDWYKRISPYNNSDMEKKEEEEGDQATWKKRRRKKVIKLWHDDVRPAPEGWVWARTNEEAMRYLATGEVVEISLDHDLGYDGIPVNDLEPDKLIDVLQLRGQSEETGLDLVKWMCREELVPERVSIHSWNPPGARAMSEYLSEHGYDCSVAPYQMS